MSALYASKKSTLEALATNLKLSIASSAFQKQVSVSVNEDADSTALLVDKKAGFELSEPNAVVKYLSSDFTDASGAIAFEESQLYPALKANSADKISQIATPAYFEKAEITAAQIILFSALYPALKDSKSTSETTEIAKWFQDFASIEVVQSGIKHALSITTLERPKAVNTGAQKVKTGHLVKPQAERIVPKDNERNILITSALPYVNNVPHLGNIIGSVLSADIYARYAKNRNYNAVYVCGTDEYGTATETKALEEKVTPQQLCDKYHKIHKEVYDWFDIGFDYFGRTTTPLQTEIAQDIFTRLHKNNYLEERTTEQLYCEEHKSFLADRFVEGTCPHCQYEDARGDQCDKCGNLLDPLQLIKPRCKVDGATPVVRESTHIYLKLNELEGELAEWVDHASSHGEWSKNAKTITASWIKRGLEPRCITRDLSWGTPVPLEGYEEKVLYVWFDATIGYVSITANYFKDHNGDDWRKWWKNPENVDLYQFMGKDNVPFHTVVFPASQIGTRDVWTKLHHLSTTEYLQYENGKFSKSRGVGVFGNSAKDTGIPASVWRYYLASVRPETSDSQFSWEEFVTKNNSELLANLGNFVNRIVKFVIAKYNGVIPKFDTKNVPDYEKFETEVNQLLKSYVDTMEAVSLRKGLELAMAISSRGNQFLQDNKLDNSLYANLPDKSDAVVGVALNLVYLVSAIIFPFMPETTKQINEILNAPALSITDKFELVLEAGHNIGKAQYLFKRIDEKKIAEWRSLYGGQQEKK
ncbi:methionyl tRNA synthetase [Scheffersomyces stipitis CBS 6054]|uniref:methionine--tRNA ligase n=1 Tax=Scheffersomyces stipitis (strain ATCC 58785 / CBS 6054 / NBRC 10063 / NRRL Y-11545) TaxID=322104 RepID=A3LNS2_PICST|nr:methionyl tRNA synthetase [Scheffersomyces stipitis CBS 6054]ABN64376.1 methionyl tRNA synthetase [Scheffersomyces stipitis CBS 6054]